METKNCQNCKQDFTIDPEDFAFYEKVKVPPPTFCPECRQIRRMCWRNVRSLYRRSCGLCNKIVVSMYPDDGAPVYCMECYISDRWDPFEHAQEIDWSRDFFSQLYELFKKQPRIFQYRIGTVVNSDYGNSVVNSKNSYMCFSVLDSEDVMYSESIDKSKDTMDCLGVRDLNQCSWNITSAGSYNTHFQVDSQNNIDSFFLYDCVNCQNCCLSSNLRNQQYVFNNQKLSKEAYLEEVQKLQLNTRAGFAQAKKLLSEIARQSIHRYSQTYASANTTGDFISNSKDVHRSFDVQNSEGVRYVARILSCKDAMDTYAALTGELVYECVSPSGNAYKQVGSILCLGSRDLEYSLFCDNSSDCFGCVGLRNAQFCILNKQYTKEEYTKLVPKLREHMQTLPYIDQKGRSYGYGDFFPFELSPFSYNETIAVDYYPISGKNALEKGYNWKIREKRDYAITVLGNDLPDDINDVSESILGETVGCAHRGLCEHQCTVAFRIVPQELAFYKAKKLPLPEVCSNCRHYERVLWRNPFKLWHRTCMHEGCQNEFETTYAPDRPEVVYCESCYQKEVL